mgnify:CR=1 FL=1
MEPIRVLQVVTYMGRGGLETMLMNYYRNINRNKVQFDFLVHRDFEADYDQEILYLGGKIYRLSRLNPFSKKYLNELGQFFKDHTEYKIVHSHLDCMAGIPLKYAKKNGVPIRIAHAHSSNQTKDKKYLLKLIFKKNIKKNATELFACAQDAGLWMFGYDQFHVINNAIDTKAYVVNKQTGKEVRQELKIPEDAFVVGHVGRFAPPKNHTFIIRVFAKVLKEKPNAFLLLVGDGDLRREAEDLTVELGIQNHVIFAGMRSDINRMLQAMDVFLFPSIYEGLPLSIIEAQTAGLPCLISDKVPIECRKTDLVSQLSLNDSLSAWKDAVIDAGKVLKRDTSKEISDAGFDICQNARWLEDFYLQKYREVGERNRGNM